MPGHWYNDLEGFYDFYGLVMQYAPDFPEEDFLAPEEQLNLDSAFNLLVDGLSYLNPPLREDERSVILATFDEARQAFAVGDEIRGASLLQNLEDKLFER